ncbi:MAG TPA: sigma 54-interacting transcriptional regulator [Kofleriaceae bacterium]|nr:sigma 54-interacting transcriptional regulator [Kofleriaceae bacterium]
MENERTVRERPVGQDTTERDGRPAILLSPHLLIVAADGTWTSRPLPMNGSLTIGRSREADIWLTERAVSRQHARLETTRAGELRLIDLGSANGTRVGETVVRNSVVTVRSGEPIVIGRTVLVANVPAGTEHDAPSISQPGLVMGVLNKLIAKTAPTLVNVLLLGETGVGKGVIAEQIHRLSRRANAQLMQLNCAGFSATLLESELFGHERGAFTNATEAKPGLLEAAAGGTVFLDEVGEMPLEVQAKLLLAIETRVIRRLGATRARPIDVRFICATHRDLETEIRRGGFRADFYYRINGVTITIPPLRKRRDEIDGLITRFADDAARSWGLDRVPTFTDDALQVLRHYPWPGNIRELRHVVERAVLFSERGHVTARVLADGGLQAEALAAAEGADTGRGAERDRVVAALEACGGNQSQAARKLGIARNTLIARMRKYGLQRPRARGDST